MIPSFCLTRLNHRYNTMTCKNCTCDKPTGHIDFAYEEQDASPLAKQHQRFFDEFCKENPSAPECLIYES